MWIPTHFKIAKLSMIKLDELFPEEEHAKIRTAMFYLGSMAPDMSPIQFKHPHFYQESAKYIFEKLEKLKKNKKLNFISAYKLGKGVHYLSDFCCCAHSVRGGEKFSDHMRYEREMDKYVQENFDELLKNTLCEKIQLKTFEDIMYYLDKIIFEKKDIQTPYVEDITRSMQIATTLYQSMFALA